MRGPGQLPYVEKLVEVRTPQAASHGIVCAPTNTDSQRDLAVVIIAGGFQVRSGSHRQAVRLARHLAAAGFSSLRWDLAGLGDATGAAHSFEHLSAQTEQAVDTLRSNAPHVRRMVLWGVCDGASAALLYAHLHHDPAIVGLALLNPWVRSDASLARTHVRHYYIQRLTDADFWRKLLRGGVGLKAAKGLVRSLRLMRRSPQAAQDNATFQQRMARSWSNFHGSILLLISDQDITGQEFLDTAQSDPDWRGCLQRTALTHTTLQDADHTCASAASDAQLRAHLVTWLEQL